MDNYSTQVSVVIPFCDAELTLRSTIQSVLDQVCDIPYEIILVNDASQDRSLNVALYLATINKNVEVINLKRRSGVASARNAGISAANSRFIAFCDSDDIWHPTKIAKQHNFMLANSLVISHTAYCKFNDGAEIFWDRRLVMPPASTDYNSLLHQNVIGCSTVMLDMDRIGDCRFPDFKLRQDFAFWLNILAKDNTAHALLEPLVAYRVGHRTLSSNKCKAALYHWKVLRSQKNLKLFAALRLFATYFVRSINKYNR